MTAADRDAAFREVVAVFCEHGFRPEPERCPAGCAVATHNRFGEAVTSTPNVADVAAVLAEHQINVARQSYPTYSCSCAEWDGNGSLDTVQAARAHVAAALLASEPLAQALAAVETLARVEALAEEWEGWARQRSTTRIDAFRDAAELIRTALRPEGGTRVHNHPPYRPTCNERVVDGQLRGACINDDGSDR